MTKQEAHNIVTTAVNHVLKSGGFSKIEDVVTVHEALLLLKPSDPAPPDVQMEIK